MKCREGHEMAKIPFQNPRYMVIGLYCEICEPSHHEIYQKMKADRVAKMQMGKKNIKAVNLMNAIAKAEGE